MTDIEPLGFYVPPSNITVYGLPTVSFEAKALLDGEGKG